MWLVLLGSIQRHLDRLEKWAHRDLINLNKIKCKALYLGWATPHINMSGDEQMGSSPAKKDLEVLVGESLAHDLAHDLTMFTCSSESQLCPVLHQKPCNQALFSLGKRKALGWPSFSLLEPEGSLQES